VSRSFSTVAHDYGRPLIATFRYTSPAAGSLSDVIPDGTPVVAVIVPRDTGPALVDREPATIVSSVGGVVTLRYDFTSPETDTPGTYQATFEAAASGGPVTLPTLGAIPVIIRPDLG
jgi:hypothetical protein